MLSEGIDPVSRSALAFNVGLARTRSLVGGTAKLALGRIVGAGRTDFSEGARTRSVATVGSDMILGMPSMMLTRVAIVRDENKKTQVNSILRCFWLINFVQMEITNRTDMTADCSIFFDEILLCEVKIPLSGGYKVAQAPSNHNRDI